MGCDKCLGTQDILDKGQVRRSLVFTKPSKGGGLVCWGSHNQIAQTGWLQQEVLVFSKFRKLEVQGQFLRTDFSCELSAHLQRARLLLCPHVASPLCTHIPGASSFSCKDVSPVASFQLNQLFKQLFSKYGYIRRYWGFGRQPIQFWVTQLRGHAAIRGRTPQTEHAPGARSRSRSAAARMLWQWWWCFLRKTFRRLHENY